MPNGSPTPSSSTPASPTRTAPFNQYVEGIKVDLHWPQHKLIVEVDGFQAHGSRRAFEDDRRRDQILAAAGYTVIRITWLQLTNEPYRVIAAIAQALGRAALAA